MIIYTYYSSPWNLTSGDDVRIHTISSELTHIDNNSMVLHLSNNKRPEVTFKSNLIYQSYPRRFYQLISRFIKINTQEELNFLVKTTHLIDEFIFIFKSRNIIKKEKLLYVFGTITLSSFFIKKVLKYNINIMYDPLANYAQTLYIRSRKNLINLLRYGIFLILHKNQIKHSDVIIYPSRKDLINAKKMFDVKQTYLLPNPYPICYNSLSEFYGFLKKKNEDKPFFVLLAGGKGRTNFNAVKLTIEVFDKLPEEMFKLYITGPWEEFRNKISNKSILIIGTVPLKKLKEVLAISNFGLAPVFDHNSGSFMKVLAYLAADLYIIASPYALQDVNHAISKFIIVMDKNEYENIIEKIIKEFYNTPRNQYVKRNIAICKETNKLQDILYEMIHKLQLQRES